MLMIGVLSEISHLLFYCFKGRVRQLGMFPQISTHKNKVPGRKMEPEAALWSSEAVLCSPEAALTMFIMKT